MGQSSVESIAMPPAVSRRHWTSNTTVIGDTPEICSTTAARQTASDFRRGSTRVRRGEPALSRICLKRFETFPILFLLLHQTYRNLLRCTRMPSEPTTWYNGWSFLGAPQWDKVLRSMPHILCITSRRLLRVPRPVNFRRNKN